MPTDHIKIGLLLVIFILGFSQEARCTEIRVNLFDQPCSLVGPSKYSTGALKKIHNLSPEQFPPPRSTIEAEKWISKLESNQTTPKELASYKEKLKRKLTAWKNIHLTLDGKLPSLELLPFFKVSAKQAVTKSLRDSKRNREEILLELSEYLETRPEEEFHKILSKLNIHYQCDFDSSDSTDGEDDETPAAVVSPKA